MKNKKLLKVVSLMALATTCVASGVLALNTKVANAASEDVFHELGASVRVSTTDKGIRFAFGLPEDKTGDGYEIGTLVIPKDVLGDDVLNHNSDTVDAVAVDYTPIPCTKNWVPNEELDGAQDGYNYYNAALTDIPELNYNTVLVARSYYKDNEGNYTYSDPVERSIGYVASAALNDGYNDTKNILTGIVSTGYGDTALTVEGGEELLSVADASTLTASNEKGYLPVWSSSNPNVATVDKTGKVTAVKGGETTVTATIGNVTAEKTVYVIGEGLYADQLGMRVNGYNMTNNPTYMTMNIGANGEMIIGAKFQASWDNYHAGLVWNNIASAAYYDTLVANGYKYLTFDLKVDGADEDKVSDLYVFCGQQLDKIEQVDGVYKVKVLVSDISRVYDAITTNLPNDNRQGQIGTRHGMFLAWRDNRGTDRGVERNYVFTISNPKFTIPTLEVDFAEDNTDLIEVGKTTTLTAQTNVGGEITWSSSNEAIATVVDGVVTGVKGGEVTITATSADGLTESETVYVVGDGLYSDQIGARMNGWNMSSNVDYCGVTTGENGETVITSQFLANATYSPALVLRNMYSKAYYQALIASGYTKLTFGLKVEGDVTDLYVFGKQVSALPQNNGVYAVVVDVQHIVNHYDTMNTIATSGSQVGQASSLAAKLISWKSPANDWSSTRNYVFTIANATFNKAATLAVDFATGSEASIIASNTTTLVATSNWDTDFVEWTTSDDTIATVVNGVVTGVASGEVTITATLDGVSVSKNITVVAPTLDVEFETDGKDLIDVNETTSLIAYTNGNVDNVEWTTSDATIATVQDGIVMGMKGGEATITATLAGVSVSKTVYVVGAGLYSDQIGVLNAGWNYTNKEGYFSMETGANGEMIATTTIKAVTATPSALTVRNLFTKAYYEKLIANGYTKLAFTLNVGGENAANVSDLYVFNKKLTGFAKNANGDYVISADLQTLVDYYDTIATLGHDVAATKDQFNIMLLGWKDTTNNWAARNYVFTISEAQFVKGILFADNFGMRIQGNVKTDNANYITMELGENNELIINAKFEATSAVNGNGYHAGLVFRGMGNTDYYNALKAQGYTKVTFDLKIEGKTAADTLENMVVFCGQQISSLQKVGDVYKVEFTLDKLIEQLGTINQIDPDLGGQKGTTGSRSAMFLAWRDNRASDIGTSKSFTITISNAMYV